MILLVEVGRIRNLIEDIKFELFSIFTTSSFRIKGMLPRKGPFWLIALFAMLCATNTAIGLTSTRAA